MKRKLKEKLKKIEDVEKYVETKKREADQYYNDKVTIADELVEVAEKNMKY